MGFTISLVYRTYHVPWLYQRMAQMAEKCSGSAPCLRSRVDPVLNLRTSQALDHHVPNLRMTIHTCYHFRFPLLHLLHQPHVVSCPAPNAFLNCLAPALQ